MRPGCHHLAMSSPSRPLGAVLVVAALAFTVAFGAVGGADAAGLTSRAVRKMATKAVKKQAGHLSVAHAATADSATSALSADTSGVATGS